MDTWFTLLNYKVSYLEAFSTIFLLLNVYLATKENVWSWLTGMIGISLYGLICYFQGYTPELGLQMVYFASSVWGWYNWLKGGTQETELKVSALPYQQIPYYLGVVVLLILGWAVVATKMGGNQVWWTSINTGISLVGQYMLIQKIRENWWVWIGVNISYVAFYLTEGFLFLSIVYAIFILLCFKGLTEWKVTM